MNKEYSADVIYHDKQGNVDKKQEIIDAMQKLFFVGKIRAVKQRECTEYIIAYESKGAEITYFVAAYVSTRSKKRISIIFKDYMSYIKEKWQINMLSLREVSYLHHLFPEDYIIYDDKNDVLAVKDLSIIKPKSILAQPNSVTLAEQEADRVRKAERYKESLWDKNKYIVRYKDGTRKQVVTCQYEENIVEVYKFPEDIQDATDCFRGCTSLKKCCAIPKSVKYYKDMFKGAENFKGIVKCSSNIENIEDLGLINGCRVERDLDVMSNLDESQELV